MSQSDFQLPGLSQNPNGVASLIVTLVFLYSRRWNRRRLEHHTYGFWSKVFTNLIFDLEPFVFHIPQLTLHLPPPEHPDLSIYTDAGSNGDETIPDFTVMGVSAKNRVRTSSDVNPRFPALEKWEDLIISWARPFLIAELKRTPPRSIKDKDTFTRLLKPLMRDAMDDAKYQAQLAFEVSLYKGLNELMLLAACGEWWRFGIFSKDDLAAKSTSIFPMGAPSDSEDDDKVSYQPGSRGAAKNVSEQRPSSLIRHFDLRNIEEKFFDNVEDAMPSRGKWSLFIQFGTKASNQRLYLVHRWLKEQLGVVGAAPYRDEDSEPSADELNIKDKKKAVNATGL